MEIVEAFMSDSDDTSVDINIGDTFYILWSSGDLEDFVRNNTTIHDLIVPNASNIMGWFKDEDKAIQKAIEYKNGNTSN
jgi:hypothetical protein